MASVYSENIKIYNAEAFKNSVTATNNSIYFTFGKCSPWSNDAAPPQTNTSVSTFNDIWKNMIGAKVITGLDVRHVIPRHQWTANTVYDMYDDCTCSINLFSENTKFYVVTTDYNVYKCISNNDGANSTAKPTSVVTSATFTTADGYVWKYMYTIPAADQLKYTTESYIPVKTLTVNDSSLQWLVQANATPGSINAYKITNSGNNYSNANNITITVSGDGTGANAIAQVNTSSNTISNIVVINPGLNYTYADVTVTDTGSGSNASVRAIISPPGGHGSDALRELGGAYLILNPRLQRSEGNKFPVTNDYRQISLIANPYKRDTTAVSTNSVIQQYTTLTLNGVTSSYAQDEYVYQGGSLNAAYFKGVVLEWDSSNSKIKLTNVVGTPTTEILTGASSLCIGYVDSVTYPELEVYSGQLLYTDNIKPISRDNDQVEDFKIILKF